MNRGLACLALAGLAALPRALCSQSASPSVPEALKDSALAVRVFAVVPTQPPASLQPPEGSSPDATSSPAPGGLAPSSTPQPGQAAQPANKEKDKGPDWQVESVKYTVPGTPVPFKFVGANLVVLVQVTPFSRRNAQGLVLVTQGQVWVKDREGGISYRTTINTLSVNYGEKVFFYPLGVDSSGKGPLRLEISVFRASDLPDKQGGATQAPADKGAADKSPQGDSKSGK